MKTDLVEIFQTIRAAMQPYATIGFTNRINSDVEYDLWSDKNMISAEKSGTERNETFFACVKINGNVVDFLFSSDVPNSKVENQLTQLDEIAQKQIENDLSLVYKLFKEKEWV